MHGKFGGDSIMAVSCGSRWVEEQLAVVLHHNHEFANYAIFKRFKATVRRQIAASCVWYSRSMFVIPWHYCTVELTYCICPISHTHATHSSSPLPLALVAVINISQVYESYLAFVPVEKQTARRLSRGAICVTLFSGVCRASRCFPVPPVFLINVIYKWSRDVWRS